MRVASPQPIDLTSIDSMPGEILARLKPYRETFLRACHIEECLDHDEVLSIVRDLNDRCIEADIIGYHFTRSFKERILAQGLVAKAGKDRRAAFLKEFGNLLSASQLRDIEEAWTCYFAGDQTPRDERVWFNLTLDALGDGAADRLLRHFGGEVIYMPLADNQVVAPILRSIGDALVVTCALEASSMTAFTEHPWGEVWLGAYHRGLNPSAERVDRDIYMSRSLPPERILSIREAHESGVPRSWRIGTR